MTVERIFSAEVTEVPNQRSMVCLSSRSPAKPSAWMARTTVASEVWVAAAISIAVCSSTTSRLSLI
ncbi:hypothetical protein SB00610_03295 [Klebsiella quasipneumoniae subsp. similipneumoniae]|nr:hypothetical protein SB00610_03295 [Klebsiella quasipneumoniae subsp. similipneumoniae]